jgi:uncharacterized protein
MKMILPISLTITAAAALLHVWLSYRVSQLRLRHKVSIGDGDNLAVRTRMRAHANFAENTPLVLILIALLELAGTHATFLLAAGMIYVLARILHAFGMDHRQPSKLRMIGILGSWGVLLALAGYGLVITSMEPRPAETRTVPYRLSSS